MMHLIDGKTVNLRGMSDDALIDLIRATEQRAQRVQEELESLVGEHIRRSDNVHQLQFRYEGPAVG